MPQTQSNLHRDRAEKSLFFALWALILLGAAFYWVGGSKHVPTTELSLSPDILPWFKAGVIKERDPDHFTVELSLTDEYRRTLEPQGRRIHLHYKLTTDDAKTHQDFTKIHLSRTQGDVHFQLANPQRLPASKIELSLGQ